MTKEQSRPIGYILKRYPRLSETFILNEMRALERLGMRLQVFSLMRVEGSLAHPTVAEVRAPITYFPETWLGKIVAVAKAHLTMAWAVPLRYLHACGLALLWSVRSCRPFSVWKQFLRSAYVAVGCRRHQVIHLHAHFANAPATVARLVSVMCNIPYSFTTHAKDLYLTRKIMMRRRVASASFVLTCTRYNIEYLRSFVPPRDWGKIYLVYHGIDLGEFPFPPSSVKPALNTGTADHPAPLILSVGRMVPKKGMGDLISACRLLMARGVPFRCVIVGDGPLRGELASQARELGLERLVTFPGAMAHDGLVSLYGQASVFALAPHIANDGDRDGIPNVLVESLYMGVPVVSTPVSGIPELITPEVNGLLVAQRDSTALATAIARLLADPLLCRRLALAGRQTVVARFDMARNVTGLLQLLLGQGSTADLLPTTGESFAVHTAPLQNTLSNEIPAGATYNSHKG